MFNGQQSKDRDKIETLITIQLEKYFFWNDNFSLVNRHESSGTGRRRKVDELFHLYPVFFVYDVLIRLNSLGYEGNHLSDFEVNNFLALARTNSEVSEVVDRIVQYREHEEIYELEKYLRLKSGMDARFFKVLQNSKYFAYAPERITLKNEYFEEVAAKVETFKKLTDNGQLIEFTKSQPSRYKELLFSPEDLINYHLSLRR